MVSVTWIAVLIFHIHVEQKKWQAHQQRISSGQMTPSLIGEAFRHLQQSLQMIRLVWHEAVPHTHSNFDSEHEWTTKPRNRTRGTNVSQCTNHGFDTRTAEYARNKSKVNLTPKMSVIGSWGVHLDISPFQSRCLPVPGRGARLVSEGRQNQSWSSGSLRWWYLDRHGESSGNIIVHLQKFDINFLAQLWQVFLNQND